MEFVSQAEGTDTRERGWFTNNKRANVWMRIKRCAVCAIHILHILYQPVGQPLVSLNISLPTASLPRPFNDAGY